MQSAELTAGSFTFGLTSREETCWFSLCSWWFCSFRLKPQNVAVRRAGPWGGFYTIGLGWGRPNKFKLTVEVKLGDRKATFELLLVAHLTTNVDQGDESELPLDLCPGRCHLRRISRRAKGREYTTVLPVGICQELMALGNRLQTLWTWIMWNYIIVDGVLTWDVIDWYHMEWRFLLKVR